MGEEERGGEAGGGDLGLIGTFGVTLTNWGIVYGTLISEGLVTIAGVPGLTSDD